MTDDLIRQRVAELGDAMIADDEVKGRAIVVELVADTLINLSRIATALEHIGRNIKAPA